MIKMVFKLFLIVWENILLLAKTGLMKYLPKLQDLTVNRTLQAFTNRQSYYFNIVFQGNQFKKKWFWTPFWPPFHPLKRGSKGGYKGVKKGTWINWRILQMMFIVDDTVIKNNTNCSLLIVFDFFVCLKYMKINEYWQNLKSVWILWFK